MNLEQFNAVFKPGMQLNIDNKVWVVIGTEPVYQLINLNNVFDSYFGDLPVHRNELLTDLSKKKVTVLNNQTGEFEPLSITSKYKVKLKGKTLFEFDDEDAAKDHTVMAVKKFKELVEMEKI